jgi:hypothetical protein
MKKFKAYVFNSKRCKVNVLIIPNVWLFLIYIYIYIYSIFEIVVKIYFQSIFAWTYI